MNQNRIFTNPYEPVELTVIQKPFRGSKRLIKVGSFLILVSVLCFVISYYFIGYLPEQTVGNGAISSPDDAYYMASNPYSPFEGIEVIAAAAYLCLMIGLFCFFFGLVEPQELPERR